MKRRNVLMLVAGNSFAATAGLMLASCTKNWPTCASEEHARLLSPDKVFEAAYHNMICDTTPEVLEARVYVKTVGAVSQRLVFLGTSAVNANLDRKTKEPKLTMQWQDSSNLVVTTFPNVIADQRLTSEGLPYVVVRQANATNAPNTGKTAVLLEGADDLAKLNQLLESTELHARTDEVANLFYANFGKPQFWPVLDALWNLDEGKFPRFNWSAVRQTTVRLTIAGVWGQWSRSKPRSPDNVQLAAQYVRTQISSSDIQTRLHAITALGMVGESDDRRTLMTIARESDIAIAKRAVDSIFSIEWHNSISPSYLLQLDNDATNVEVRNFVRVLLKSKQGP